MSIFNIYFVTKTKTPINQINIVRTIARNGILSKAKLSEELNKNWSEVNDSIKSLLKKKLIVEDSNTKKSKEKFFNITSEGFSVAIWDELKLNDKNFKPITSKQFWNHVSYSNYTIQEIEEISNLFEKNILKIDSKYVLPQSFLDNIHNKEQIDYNKPKQNSDIEKTSHILKTISHYKPMKHSSLIQKLQSKNTSMDIMGLMSKGLITKYQDKYDLTHSGLLELLFIIYRDSNIELYWNRKPNLTERTKLDPKPIKFRNISESKDPEAIKITKELDKIRLKYVHLLRDIFNGGNFQKLGISFFDIVELLMKIYKNLDFTPEYTRYVEECQLLQGLDDSRRRNYRHKILKHLDIFSDEIISGDIKRWFAINPNILSTIHQMNDALSLDESLFPFLTVKDDANHSTLDGYAHTKVQKSIHTKVQRSVEKKITFDFYCIYKAYYMGWNDKLKDSRIQKDHDKEIKTLLEYSTKYIQNMEN
jgi:predicted transcriptional regulator